MSTESLYLKILLQVLNENPDIWGTVLNVSGLQVLEDAIAGTAEVGVTSSDQTLNDIAGGPSETGPSPVPNMRFMIMNITGSPGQARTVTVPARSKVYLVANSTTGGEVITFLAAGGTGVTIPAGEAQWVWCDGTDILAASAATATVAASATLADDSTLLIGVAGADFAQKALANTFTAGQVTTRVALTGSGTITVDLALSNSFYLLMDQGQNLAPPSNPTNGAMFSIVVQQDSGGPHVLSYQANTFIWAGGSPTLSLSFEDIDYLAFEYVTDNSINRWIGSIIKNLGP